MTFAYIYVGVLGLGLYSVANVYAGSAVQLLGMVFFGGSSNTSTYSTPEIEQLKVKMGLRDVEVFSTNNRFVKSPFTNAVTKKVYLTEKWLNENPESEVLSTLGHEFGHVLTRRRFALETAGAVAAVLSTSILLALHSINVVVQVEDFAALVLMLTLGVVEERVQVRHD